METEAWEWHNDESRKWLGLFYDEGRTTWLCYDVVPIVLGEIIKHIVVVGVDKSFIWRWKLKVATVFFLVMTRFVDTIV